MRFRYCDRWNDHNAYPRSLAAAPPEGWEYAECEVEFDALLGRPWAHFRVLPGEIIHASSLLPTNGTAWVLDTDHVGYLFAQAVECGTFLEQWWEKFRREFAAAVASSNCLGVVAWSEAAARSVREACYGLDVDAKMVVAYPVVLRPPGVLPARRRPASPDRPVRMLLVDGQTGVCAQPGRKNVQAGLRAFQRLKDAGYAVELILVDPQERVPALPGITVLPSISRTEMFEILLDVDILLFLSRQDSFGYTLMEAMSCGVCVVAATAASLPAVAEIVEDARTGYLVPYRTSRNFPVFSADLDEERLLRILVELIESPQRRLAVATAAQAEFTPAGRFCGRRRNARVAGLLREFTAGRSLAVPRTVLTDGARDAAGSAR